ncbi:MAG: hypothetical protein CR974_04450 [Gammaproteobacteria bacterium]|nr:MAG: hypothetical protein CR974_04450 [Gammaproteobacteria bacterium]
MTSGCSQPYQQPYPRVLCIVALKRCGCHNKRVEHLNIRCSIIGQLDIGVIISCNFSMKLGCSQCYSQPYPRILCKTAYNSIMTRLSPTQIHRTRQLAERAAACALSYYQSDYEITIKSDESPVTQADLAVSELLEKHLPAIADFPVLSEESQPEQPLWTGWETYWLIDPIDGTKHFINRTGDFCVCIALIHRNQAVFGLIIAPTTGALWLAQTADEDNDMLLEKYQNGQAVPMPTDRPEKPIVALSTKTLSKRMSILLAALPAYDWYNRGSALKYIDIAEGKASLYPKMWDTCEWDSAAGQCILACAGGGVMRFDTRDTIHYGKSASLINPHFFAYRDLSDETLVALCECYPQAVIHPRDC